MSKLYAKYVELKQICSSCIYIFKAGAFYISLEDDAKILSELFGFKLTHLNEDVIKSGFPLSRLQIYCNYLTNNNISYKVIDNKILSNNFPNNFENIPDINIISTIISIDIDNTSGIQAINILHQLKEKCLNLIEGGNNNEYKQH